MCSAQFGIGHPTNITRHVGDTNVFIPCPFGGPASVTWRIGDTHYAQSRLPDPYFSIPGGLILRAIEEDMSGLIFQCLIPSNDGLYTTESDKGTLIVSLSTQNDSEATEELGKTKLL